MKSSRNLPRILMLLIGILGIMPVYGTHYMGVDITYECLGTCTYRVYLTRYWDCAGGATQGSLPINPNNPPAAPFTSEFNIEGTPLFPGQNCSAPVAIGNWTFDPASIADVTPVCPTITTSCDGNQNGQVNGVIGFTYFRDYDFCNTTCNIYTLAFETCCRNNSITSLTNPGTNGMYVGSVTINTQITPCNSTPVFNNPPIPYICSGQTYTFNQGAFDPDGDSLVFSLGPCYDDPPAQQVTYAPGYTPTAPLGPGWNVNVNSLTGDITISPNPTGPIETGVMCLIVEEYRNNVKIGQVVRDIQITVVDCASLGQTNVPPTITQVTNLSPGLTANGLVIDACACDLVQFDIPATDPDQGQNFKMYVSSFLNGSSFADATIPLVPADTITSSNVPPTGQFTWVPTKTGVYTFLVTVEDDGCPLLGINQYSIVINVNSCSLDPVALTSNVSCFGIEFEGVPCGGAAPFTYSWTGNGGLNGAGQTFVHNYPGPGIYNYTLTITDSTGVSSSTNGTLNLANTAVADGGPDIVLCPGQVGTIGTPAVPGYTYQWSSPNNLGWSGTVNPATAQGDVALNNGTNSAIVIPYVLAATDPNGCTDLDTVFVTYTPKPPSNFNVTNTICVGSPATAVYTSPAVPGAVYNWFYGGGGTGTSIGPGPHNINFPTPGTFEVRLMVDVNGCQSDTTVNLVKVNPIPTSTFNITSQICAGQPAAVNYTGSANPTGNTQFIWDFDGGAGVGGAGPFTLVWPTAGTKTVTLTVIENGCIGATFTQTVNVFPVPTSDFTIPPTVCVDDPVQIVYSGIGSPGASYAWQFGSGSTASGTGVGPYNVSWNSPGVKTVTLQVEENGCISTVTTKTITVKAAPVASIAPVANQCFPGNSFTFVYNGDPGVSSYAWNFGQDGFPATSSQASPAPVSYQNVGPKKISLVVTRDGCVSDSAFAEFEVVPEPSADFVISSAGVCESECVSLTYTGISLGATQAFSWNLGSGSIPVTSSQDTIDCVTYTSPGSRDITLTVDYRGCVVSQTQQLVINDAPEVTAGPDREFCEGDGGVQLQASVTGGTPTYFYSWTCTNGNTCGLSSNAIEDPFANPFVGQTTDSIKYYFQVTDVNGCTSNLDSVWVSVKAKPRMDAGPDVSICTDGPGAFLNGSVANDNNAPFPIGYQWSPATGLSNPNIANPFARPDTTTIYTLIGSSTNGCASDVNTLDTLSTVTVTVLPKPEAEAGPDTALCVGESIVLTGFASSAGPSYSYQWTPATPGTISDPTSPTPTISPTFTTTFFLVVTSNGCDSDADSVTVLVDTKPTISPGGDETICYLDSVQLNGAAAGDPNANNYTYQWTPAIGLSNANVAKPLASPSVTTTYQVSANSNFGCGSDAASITVTVEPTPIVEALSQDTVLCEGDTISLSAVHSFVTPAGSPVTYLWTTSNPNGGIIGSPALPAVAAIPGQSVLYTVTASIAGDCPTTDEVLVTVSPKIEAEIVADTTRICAGDATQLAATGGLGNATFTWSPAAGLSNPNAASTAASPDQNTIYQILIQEGACSDTASVEIVVNPTPQAKYFSTQSTGCPGLTVSFFENTENAVAYLWDFGDGSAISNEPNPTHTYNEPGSYTVTLTTTGIGGCETSSQEVTVEVSDQSFASFLASPSADTALALPGAMVEFTDQSSNAVSWFWDFGDGSVSTDPNPTHQYSQAGDYTVSLRVTDANGCVATLTDGPFSVISPELLVPNVFTPNGDGINDAFTVRYTGSEDFYLEVFDRWGRMFFSAEAADETWPGIDGNGNNAPEGVYYYSLQIGESSYQGNVTLMR